MITHNDDLFSLPPAFHDNCFHFIIQDPTGIHARPAGALAKTAEQFESTITVSCGEKHSSAKSVIQLMSLGASCGSELTVHAEGADAAQAIAAIYQYMEENL